LLRDVAEVQQRRLVPARFRFFAGKGPFAAI